MRTRDEILNAIKPIADAARRCLEYDDPKPDVRVLAEDNNCQYELLKGEEGALDQTSLTVADLHVVRELYELLLVTL